jgi:hypothetical protein
MSEKLQPSKKIKEALRFGVAALTIAVGSVALDACGSSPSPHSSSAPKEHVSKTPTNSSNSSKAPESGSNTTTPPAPTKSTTPSNNTGNIVTSLPNGINLCTNNTALINEASVAFGIDPSNVGCEQGFTQSSIESNLSFSLGSNCLGEVEYYNSLELSEYSKVVPDAIITCITSNITNGSGGTPTNIWSYLMQGIPNSLVQYYPDSINGNPSIVGYISHNPLSVELNTIDGPYEIVAFADETNFVSDPYLSISTSGLQTFVAGIEELIPPQS